MQIQVKINLMPMKKKKKRILMYTRENNSHGRATKTTFFTKKWRAHIEIVFNGNSKKEFCVHFLVQKKTKQKTNKKSYLGFIIFRVGGKNCIVKNVCYCIVFPESLTLLTLSKVFSSLKYVYQLSSSFFKASLVQGSIPFYVWVLIFKKGVKPLPKLYLLCHLYFDFTFK